MCIPLLLHSKDDSDFALKYLLKSFRLSLPQFLMFVSLAVQDNVSHSQESRLAELCIRKGNREIMKHAEV